MSDVRIVQCFGTKRRPHKEDATCRRRFMWTALGNGKTQFGRRGTQACPHCGTMPDFRHPLNKLLAGEIDPAQAEAEMPAYLEELKNRTSEK
jgi:hypothetical protein